MKRLEVVGKVFDRLTVIKDLPSRMSGVSAVKSKRYILCRCSCGNEVEIAFESVRGGKVGSCGCLRKESIASVNYTHGDYKSVEYKAWAKIKGRCHCETDAKYPIYGGRGIKVCDRWRRSYEAFLEDMGRRPKGKSSIDRLDVNGDYRPGNCRWSTCTEQANNTRRNVRLSFNNVEKTMAEWAKFLGINYKNFHKQITYNKKELKDFIHG